MGEWLTIEQSVNRDAEGKLIPVTVEVEFLEGKPKIQVMPINRGELKKLDVSGGGDSIVLDHITKPKYTAEDMDKMSQATIQALIYAVMSASVGLPQEDIKDKTLKVMLREQEDLLKKKSI